MCSFRCCGKSFGCPYNSAALLHPASESFVECSPSSPKPCQTGFSCARSNTLSRHICCSATEGNSANKRKLFFSPSFDFFLNFPPIYPRLMFCRFSSFLCCLSHSPITDTCPNGESPLSSPSECSSTNSESCPPGYVCRNSKCCSSAGCFAYRLLSDYSTNF